MKKLFGIGAAALLLTCSFTLADDKKNAPVSDREFLIKAATGGHAEVKLGELAEKNAANEKVKEFGRRMVKDHTEANNKLAEHAKNQKVAIAAGFEKEHRDMYMKLSKLQGAEFDKAYIHHMVMDHEEDIKLFENEAKNGQDPELKKFAEETLPTLREHLKMAKECHEAVKGQ